MTEIAIRPTADLTVPSFGPENGTALIMAAVEQFAAVEALAKALSSTAFVPEAFRGKPADTAAAIMYGAAVGLDPMTSVRSIHVIKGTPGLAARTMVAIAQSAGHRVWTVASSAQSVTVSGQRKGSPDVETVTWDIDRAKAAGYFDKNPNYKTIPEDMLYARAASSVVRRIASDALHGMDYSAEELRVIDHVDEPAERPKRESAADLLPQTPQGAAPSGTTQGIPASGAAEVEGKDVAASDAPRPADTTPPEPDAALDAATARQVSAINIALNARGVGNKGTGEERRTAKLTWLTEATGRSISSSKDLTKAEAGTLLDHFADEDAAKTGAPEPEPFPND
jgi:hypothetical protein